MNYLNTILKGYYEPHFDKYLQREFENSTMELQEFKDHLLKPIQRHKQRILNDYYNDTASGNIINLNKCSLPLLMITGSAFVGQLTYGNIIEIEKVINDIKQGHDQTIVLNDYKKKNLFKIGLLFASGQMNEYFKVNNENEMVRTTDKSYPKIAEDFNNDISSEYFKATFGSYKDTRDIFYKKDMMQKVIEHCNENNIKIDPYFLNRAEDF